MKNTHLLAIYRIGLLVVLFGVVLHAPLSVWLSSLWPDYTELIKAWKEILLFGLAVIAVILLTKEREWRRLLRVRLVQLSIGFILLHLLLLPVFWQGLAPSVAGLMIDLRFIAVFLLFYALTLLDPGALRSLVKTTAVGAVIIVGFGLLQITVLPDDFLARFGYSKTTITPYSTIDKNPDFVRINSTTRGPNPLGAMSVVYVSLLLAWLVYRWRRLSVTWRLWTASGIFATLAVMFASFSRSAYMALIASMGISGALASKVSTKYLFVGLSVTVVAGLAGVGLLGSSDWFANVVLHEDPESVVIEKSNPAHIASLEEGVNRLAKQPLGAGIGSTGSAVLYGVQGGPTIENYYLFVAHEAGWLGLATFMAIVILVLKELYHRRDSWLGVALFASGIGLAIIGLLLPVWTDDTTSITWWALVGGIIGSSYAKRTRQQEATRTT
ncbi:hypothetical protein RAAC3_TM7C00001G0280 [Candidatus Saccharibacteria bacterium RAAC3_TM7_1]|nr:hypothetical protein RAAC3_TM7C00001G0280 [Candidatus Saccharibacteria bacterium RAAC3_TM7_1]HCZ28318.1 hypothetical protein [Candidatus Saccharibacteria bacterium]